MNLLEEYKDLYYKEIEYSERLNNKINTGITFLTVLGSAQIILWVQFKSFNLKIYTIIYFISCLISFLLFIMCVYRFYKTYTGYKYNYFPIEDMALTVVKTYQIAGDNKKDIKKANKHIHNMYCERYLNDAINNRKNNEIKNNRYKKFTNCICITFIITIFVYALNIGIEYYESKTLNNNTNHVIIDGGEINVRERDKINNNR